MDKRPVTIFCDIDGTLVMHEKPDIVSHPKHGMTLLNGTIEKLIEWVLINDRKPNKTEDYAISINLDRNKGISEIKI